MTNIATTEQAFHSAEFPFETIDTPAGENYWSSVEDATVAGYDLSQIWSVACADHETGVTFTYGPSHHCINVIGYVVTAEKHNGATYYEEDCFDLDDAELGN